MMTLKARIISIVAALIFFFIVSWLVRKRRIYNIYAITWLLTVTVFLSLGLFSNVATFLASALGIYFTPVAIISVALGGIFLILLHLSIIVTDQHIEIKRLEKELAILKTEVPKVDTGHQKAPHS